MLDLGPTGAARSRPGPPTASTSTHNHCAGVFDTYMRDIDFSPDGSYFVVSDDRRVRRRRRRRHAVRHDHRAGRPTAPATAARPGLDYTGGDTTYGVAVTGRGGLRRRSHALAEQPLPGRPGRPGRRAARGHRRPRPGQRPAAVVEPRPDPRSRRPGALRHAARACGSAATRRRSAARRTAASRFMPLAGGTTIPAVAAATLPNDLFLAQRTGAGSTNVLYRVNAGRPARRRRRTAARTGRPTTASSAAATPPTGAATVPRRPHRAGRHPAGHLHHRALGRRMHWNFPVPAGTHGHGPALLRQPVRRHRAVGQRVFDVNIDGGHRAVDNFDIVASRGRTRPATMQSLPGHQRRRRSTSTSAHVVENPLVNGIEIIDNDAGAPTAHAGRAPAPAGRRDRQPHRAGHAPRTPRSTGRSSAGRSCSTARSTTAWATAGSTPARSTRRPGAVGAQTTVNLYDDPDDGGRIPFAIANLTGMFYDTASAPALLHAVQRQPRSTTATSRRRARSWARRPSSPTTAAST